MDHTEERARRASSFGAEAAAYAKYRPDYPRELLVWALAPVREAAGLRVLDLAAGTGKFTGGLVALGVDVVAVEPDAAMLAELTSRFPDVDAMIGTAEDIPLPDDSAHAAFAAQALHWFDLDRALPEIRRVLRPGGSFTAVWNTYDDTVPWVGELCDMSHTIRRNGEQFTGEILEPLGPTELG
ncbi:MAG TPA: class I SAM-dependent methyltransferase, partial [Pseudonocardiaceae bacterium]|nr:class I SAM-dependent methyltransferase [Pseudonocardiaceae bacterium]